MSQITFANKVTLVNQPDVANENKVTASDMNEIKSVVNANANVTIPVELYNNTSGTTGTVTLSDSASNYSYIEIYFYVTEGGGKIHKSVKVSNPNASYVLLDMTDFNNNSLLFNTNLVYINTIEITRIRNRRFTIAESSSWTPYGSVANIFIEKVVGYK